jgi:hypothetical protein
MLDPFMVDAFGDFASRGIYPLLFVAGAKATCP